MKIYIERKFSFREMSIEKETDDYQRLLQELSL